MDGGRGERLGAQGALVTKQPVNRPTAHSDIAARSLTIGLKGLIMLIEKRLTILIAFSAVLTGSCVGGAPGKPNPDGGGTGGSHAGTGGGSATGGAMETGGETGSGGDNGGLTGTGGETGSGGVPDTGGEMGTGGLTASGTGGLPGGAGASGAAGMSATGGHSGTGGVSATGGTTGTGGTGGPSGGGGTGMVAENCVKALFGRYLLRTDGKLLLEADSAATQTPVLDAGSGLPLSDVTSAQEGNGHGCAVLGTTKAAWCWRTVATGNNKGQLGNGITDTSGPVFRATPVLTAVGEQLANVAAIADGEGQYYGSNSACAVTNDATLYCWGDVTWIVNGGTALTSGYAVPITKDGIVPLTGVLQAAVGPQHACAVIQGNSVKEVWCWGRNAYGALGLGDTVTHRYPTQLVGLTNPNKVLVHGSYGTTCAMDGGNVRCWGYNGQGDTGTGTKTNSLLAPTSVALMSGAALTDVVDVHGGEYFSYATWCALTSQKTLQCWGGSFAQYSAAFGLTNVIALGGTDGGTSTVRYVTSDGVYHLGNTPRMPNCGLLQ